MNKNYQIEMEKIIEKEQEQNHVPTLLLHSCCAPCSSSVLERLNSFFQITILYYNPNIDPEEEYFKRKEEEKRFLSLFPSKYPIFFLDCDYDRNSFYEVVKGLEHCKEGEERCYRCYQLRLEKTAKEAQKNHFDYFGTTLSISPYKNSNWINEIGLSLAKKYQISYLPADFKKKNGYQRSIELSQKYQLYRQDYCGCIYSKLEKERKEKEKKEIKV